MMAFEKVHGSRLTQDWQVIEVAGSPRPWLLGLEVHLALEAHPVGVPAVGRPVHQRARVKVPLLPLA